MWGSEEMMHRGAAFGRWTWQNMPMLAHVLDRIVFSRVWQHIGRVVALVLRGATVAHTVLLYLSSASVVVA
jgi:hypothetical protein